VCAYSSVQHDKSHVGKELSLPKKLRLDCIVSSTVACVLGTTLFRNIVNNCTMQICQLGILWLSVLRTLAYTCAKIELFQNAVKISVMFVCVS